MYNDDHANGSANDDAHQRRYRSPSASPTSKRMRLSPTLSRPPTSNGAPGPSGSGGHLRPLSLSILGTEPFDDFIGEVANFVHAMIQKRPKMEGHVEVEAKLGLLKRRGGDERVMFPVLSETILASEEHRFESNMTAIQHKAFNEMLNKLERSNLERTKQLAKHKTEPLHYKHSYLVDSFYESEGSDAEKIRVTRDEKTNEVRECVKKIRLGNLDIFSPKYNADWRVSVNFEMPVPHPVGSASFTRRKDRLSYSHEEFVIDLTQVTQTMHPSAPPQIMHELEIEIARPSFLLAVAGVRRDQSVPSHERDAFDELIRAFVNNIRVLVRNTRPPF